MKKIHIIPIALTVMGTFFLVRSYCHGNEWQPSAFHTITFLHEAKVNAPTTLEQRSRWQKEYDFHLSNGIRCYNDAKERAWYLPNISDREKARYCYTSAASTALCSTPSGVLAAAVTSLFFQYGLDAIDEWNYIQNKLYWSEYHFEMCDHYHSLIHKKDYQ